MLFTRPKFQLKTLRVFLQGERKMHSSSRDEGLRDTGYKISVILGTKNLIWESVVVAISHVAFL